MFTHTKAQGTIRTPLTLAALSILLAACGGGSDDGKPAVSASPARTSTAATSTSSAAAGASTTVAVNGNGSNTAAGGASATPANTGNNAGTGTPTTPVGTQANGNTSAGSTPDAGNANPTSGGTGAAPSGNTPADSTAAGQTNTGNATPSPRGDDTGATTPAASDTTAAGPVPAISDKGVRGDVLLAMMDQNACTDPWTPRTTTLFGEELDGQNGADTLGAWYTAKFDVDSYTYDMSKWEGGMPASAPGWVYDCTQPAVRSYGKPLKPGSYTFTMDTHPQYRFLSSTYYGLPWIKRGINATNIKYPVTVTDDSVHVGDTIKVSQQEDVGHLASDQFARNLPEGRKLDGNFTAEGGYTFQRSALVPFGTLRQWQDGAGNHVRLMLIAGDTPDEAKVCTDAATSLVKRLQCKSWRVPAGWTWGTELTHPKRYVIDDRSVYPNETGHLYWSQTMAR